MKHLLIAIILINVVCIDAAAQTTVAADCDRTSIENAITANGNGVEIDTISVTSAGSPTEFATPITVPAGKNLVIDGNDVCTIRAGSAAENQRAFILNPSPTQHNEVTRFAFEALCPSGGCSNTAVQGMIEVALVGAGIGNSCRVHHNTFRDVLTENIVFKSDCLFDSNTIYMPSNSSGETMYFRNGGTSNTGYPSGARSLHLGDSTSPGYDYDGAFVERNIIWNCVPNAAETACSGTLFDTSGSGITDGEFGGRAVFRYNTCYNCGTNVYHGTEGGVGRGMLKIETYGNLFIDYSGSGRRAFHYRSGNGVIFQNQIINTVGGGYHFSGTYATYRTDQGFGPYDAAPGDIRWGQCGGWGNYDLNDVSYATITGSHTGGNSTSVLVDSFKNFESYSHPLYGTTGVERFGVCNTTVGSTWYGYCGFVYANTGTEVYTLSDHQSGNTCTPPSDSQPCFNMDDTYQMRPIIACADQAGYPPVTGTSTLMTASGGAPMPVGEWPLDPASADGTTVLLPTYGWQNTICTSADCGDVQPLEINTSRSDPDGPAQTVSNIVPNYHYYNEAEADNTHCSSAFDGSCGIGVGTTAQMNAIVTCTENTAFWATDAPDSDWNALEAGDDGALYKCNSADTWVKYYQPYDYPHPTAASSLAFTVQPSGSYVSGSATLDVTVAVQLPGGATATESTATITLSGNGCTISTSMAAVAGVAEFTNVTVTGSGPCMVNATSPGLTSALSDSFDVIARYLEWSVNPSASIISGATISAAPVVLIRNADGTTDTSATDTITVSLTNCVPAAGVTSSISGTLSVAASAGVATFSSIAVSGRTPDRTCQLSASGSQITTGVGTTFRVLGATQLSFTTQPASSYSNGSTIATLVVTLYRANGVSVDTTATDDVELSGNGCVISGPTVSAVAGVATFTDNVTVNGSGSCTITASSSADLTDAMSSSFTITAAPDPPVPGTTGGARGVRARIR